MFRRRAGSDFSAEIRAHIALEAERLQAEGLSQADAEAAARRAFGNPTTAEERFYESSRWLWWDQVSRDSQYALRMLRRSPAFTIAAVLTLALGIGANTAIFSVIDAALLRPLPYPQPDRIVMLYGRAQAQQENADLSPATFLDFHRQSRALDLAGYRQSPFNVTGQDRPERIRGAVVTPDFFGVLGVQAQLGRTLTPDLDKPGAPRAVVVSYALWQRRYGASPEALGRQILIDGEPRTVVGVMPQFFQYPAESELWTAARFAVPEHVLRPDLDQSNVRDTHYFETIGRLRPGFSLAQARAEANTIARRLKQQYASDEEASSAALVTLRDDLIGPARPALMILLGAVGLLLLIACANVANILLARGAARQKEIAVRAALGAGRARLVRQFLTESILLAAGGGVLGIALAYAGLHPLRALLPEGMLGTAALKLDPRVLAFTTVVSLASGILFGLFPALHLSGAGTLDGMLKEQGRGSSGGMRAHRARSALVAIEVALAAVLLVGAGLLIRSFSRLLAVSEGFRAERVLSLKLSLSDARYPGVGDRARFVTRTLESIASLSGVSAAAVVSRLPLSPGNSTRSVDVKGRTSTQDDHAPDYLVISPDYFRGMGIRLLSGRAFTERDDDSAPPVVIVSQSTARAFWPGRNPVGEFVMVGGCGKENEWCQVVGVVENVHQHNLDQTPRPAVYVPYARDPWPFMVFVVRTSTDPAAAASAVQSAIHSVDRDQPLYGIRTMEEVVSASRSPRRVRMLLLSLFAALALALACVGIYGVMAYLVAQRAHEIGIRMALGADRKDVLRLIVGQGLKLSVAGVAAGLLLAAGLSRFLSTVLYGVGTTDAPTFAGVATLLITLAALASYLPAWRASRVDPVTALRAQ